MKKNEDIIRIKGIIYEHGPNDFGVWTDFYLTEEEKEIIENILMRHDVEGCSVRGTREELAEELKNDLLF